MVSVNEYANILTLFKHKYHKCDAWSTLTFTVPFDVPKKGYLFRQLNFISFICFVRICIHIVESLKPGEFLEGGNSAGSGTGNIEETEAKYSMYVRRKKHLSNLFATTRRMNSGAGQTVRRIHMMSRQEYGPVYLSYVNKQRMSS